MADTSLSKSVFIEYVCGIAILANMEAKCVSSNHPLIEIKMGMRDFSSEWMHCDRISTFVARHVSHNRADSLLYANLFSSALNELLETVFANHGSEGDLTCRVSRTDRSDIVELSLPCDEPTLKFYLDAVNLLEQHDVEDFYHAALFTSQEQDPRLGIFEVAVDYKAKISLSNDDGRLTLSAEMVLGGAY